MSYVPFKKIIRDHRISAGYSQGEVAKHLKLMSAQFISNFENGKSYPSPRLLPKIAKLYKVDYRTLALNIVADKLVAESLKLHKRYKVK